MNNYFIYLDNTIHGPHSAQVINSMLCAGTISLDTPVAAEGASEWSTVGQLFNVQCQPTLPPIPLRGESRGAKPAPKPKKNSTWRIAASILATATALFTFFLVVQSNRPNHTFNKPASKAPATEATPTTADSSNHDTTNPAQDLRRRAEAGDADAQYKLARTYPNSWDFSNTDNTKEVKEMIHWIKLSAEQGNPEAEYHLANCFQYGKGVTADPAESVLWYRKAAAQGVDPACLHIGYHYMTGWGVTKDAAEAAKWYRQGAKGDVYSLLALGRLYLKGDDGLPKDLVQALTYLDLTLARGVGETFRSEVQRDRDACAKDMTSEQIAEAKRLASEWKP